MGRLALPVTLALVGVAVVAALLQRRDGEHPRVPPTAADLLFERDGVSVRDTGTAFELVNLHGSWRVEKQCRRGRGTTVGPGYVSHAAAPSGGVLVDDVREPGPLNDPRYGGLGAFAWHHARGVPGSTRFGELNAWEVSVRDCAAANGGFGVAGVHVVRRPAATDAVPELVLDVLLSDGFTYPHALARVRYAYALHPARVDARVTVTTLCDRGRCGRTPLRAFVKEPKVVASVAGAYGTATFDDDGRLVCEYRGSGPPTGPVLSTGQCAADRRTRVRFDHEGDARGWRGGCARAACLEVEAAGEGGLWEGAGFDRWAAAAAERPAARATDTGSTDGVHWSCHSHSPSSPMHRRWETVTRSGVGAPGTRLGPAASVLFPAWEGGRGGFDCEPLARLFGPYGEAYSVLLTYRIV